MAKQRRTQAEARAERERFHQLATNGGSIHLVVEDEGTFVVLEGLPHVEVPGGSLPDALRELANYIEAALPPEVEPS